MSCTTCQSKFSLFTKEYGCPNCGFSYCSKCLKYKCQLPDDIVKKVCGPCYNKQMANCKKSSDESTSDFLPSPSTDIPASTLPPVDIEKKLESLDNPVKPPIVIYKQGRWDNFKSGLDSIDQALVDRLRKLKDEDKQPPPPTTDEIRRRLALLKDQDPDQNPINVYEVDTRSDQQKTEDLIQEYLETLQLSSTNDETKDIEKKLNALAGIDSSEFLRTFEEDDYDDRKYTKKLIEKALAEAALEKKMNNDNELEKMDVENPEIADESDEGTSCVMCDKTNNLVKCTGCHNDLYCSTCFEENHDDFELPTHKKIHA